VNRTAARSDISLMDRPSAVSLTEHTTDDVLYLLVGNLSESKRRPSVVASLCLCCHSLHELLPDNLRATALEGALLARPSTADLRADGRLVRVLKGEPGTSPIMIERASLLQRALLRGSVGHRLRSRPEPSSLLERGVLKADPGTSPLVVERASVLQKELLKGSISHGLRVRPDSASLVDRGVLKADPRTNMSVVVAQTRLNKELVKQIIKRMLLSRPGNKKAGVPAC